MEGRAITPEQKRAIIERLYAVWLTRPSLRLGQLIACATEGDSFYIEDAALVGMLEDWPHG